jgi:Cellulase (glycosyl hydrolase family 5)
MNASPLRVLPLVLLGVCCWVEANVLPVVQIKDDAKGFVLAGTGTPFVPWGLNYGNAGRLIEDFWESEWATLEADFSEMKGLGANVVRVHLQFARFMNGATEPNPVALDRLGRLLELGEKSGLYLDLTGLACYRTEEVPKWYDEMAEPERWAAQAAFWSAIAARCAGRSVVFCYDLMNEPLSPTTNGTNGAWYSGKKLGDYDFLQFISRDLAGRTRPAVAREWIRALTKAIRRHDARTPITVGLLPSTDPLGFLSGFIPKEIAPELDFIALHIYPEGGKVANAMKHTAGFVTHRPLIIEETFPLSCPASELSDFLDQSAAHACGWMMHYDGQTIAQLEELRKNGSMTIAQAIWLSGIELFKRGPPKLAANRTAETVRKVAEPFFGIRVVDEASGRGVPLVELRTVNNIRCVTDNAGWIAFHEPGLMGREVFFYVAGPGYEFPKDGFGFVGTRVTPKPGEITTVRVKRRNIAERIGRITGQGIYRDSELLGLDCPQPNLNPAGVMGQDSIQAVPYRGRIFYIWGDTNVPHYPLGNFQVTGATTGSDASPEAGLRFEYFMDAAEPQRLRHMMPLEGPGAVWLFGMLTLKDGVGEHLLAHYSRQRGLVPPEEQGIAEFNDERGIFEKVASIDTPEKWRFPTGHAVRVTDSSGDWFYFPEGFLHVRVRATFDDLKSSAGYEGLRFDEAAAKWHWQRTLSPTSQSDEAKLIAEGKLPAGEERFQLKDAASGKPVVLHRSSVQWNAWRQRWVLIGTQAGGKDDPSPLGEIWYAESAAPDGPWKAAVKVVSHPRYSFYNPVHHGFFQSPRPATIITKSCIGSTSRARR